MRDMQAEFNRTYSAFHLWLATEAPSTCHYDVDAYKVYAFTQTWSDTSCGFGGMAGQSITDALTVVFRRGNFAAVFIAGKYAYHVMINEVVNFLYDLSKFNMSGYIGHGSRYLLI